MKYIFINTDWDNVLLSSTCIFNENALNIKLLNVFQTWLPFSVTDGSRKTKIQQYGIIIHIIPDDDLVICRGSRDPFHKWFMSLGLKCFLSFLYIFLFTFLFWYQSGHNFINARTARTAQLSWYEIYFIEWIIFTYEQGTSFSLTNTKTQNLFTSHYILFGICMLVTVALHS